jgi:hypothetical protein
MKRLLTLAPLLAVMLAAQSCVPDSMCACTPAMPPGLDALMIDGANAPVEGVTISLWTDAGDAVAEAATDEWGRVHLAEEAIFAIPLALRMEPPAGYRVAEGQPHPVEVFIPEGSFEHLVLRVGRDP